MSGIIFSTDGGYGSFKFHYFDNGKTKSDKILNAVHQITKKSDINDETIYHFNGKDYIIGEEASNYVSVSARTFEQLVEYMPLFIYAAIKKANLELKDVGTLISGLSLANYKECNNTGKEVFKDMLSQPIKVNGEEYKIENVVLTTQGQGIYWEHMKKKENKTQKNVIVVDIGMNTLDVLVYRNRKISGEKSYANKMGVNKIVTKLSNYISSTYSIEVPSEQLTIKYLQEGKFKHKGQDISLEEAIDTIKNDYIKDVLNDMETRVGKEIIDTSDAVVFGGGGCYYLPMTMPEPHFVLAEEPFEYANVRGYVHGLDGKFLSTLKGE